MLQVVLLALLATTVPQALGQQLAHELPPNPRPGPHALPPPPHRGPTPAPFLGPAPAFSPSPAPLLPPTPAPQV